MPEGVGEVVATPPVGKLVAVPPGVGLVKSIAPPPEVLSYVTVQPIQPVLVDGEVMVGATLPAAVPIYSIPASPNVPTVPSNVCCLGKSGRIGGAPMAAFVRTPGPDFAWFGARG